MNPKNPNQIIRLDGKNVFLEVMNNAFPIGKVQINFIEYNPEAEKNNRQTKNIPIYIDMDKFLVLANDILSGRMAKLAQQSREARDKGGYRYAKEIFVDLGGVPAEKLKERGQERPDGKDLSRQFKITPGDKLPWILSAEVGPGRKEENGLIAPFSTPENPYRPDAIVRVPLSDEDFKKFALVVQTHIHSYITSQYLLKAMNSRNNTIKSQNNKK
jgi:hypothetical protein